jgi:hypothetical protein
MTDPQNGTDTLNRHTSCDRHVANEMTAASDAEHSREYTYEVALLWSGCLKDFA